MTETTFRVIGFGTNEFGFFNQFAWGCTLGYALGFYQAHIADPEMDGAVIIKVQHEDWEVVEQFGTEGVEVVYGPAGNHKVMQLVGV
jgi:hypothetical protein